MISKHRSSSASQGLHRKLFALHTQVEPHGLSTGALEVGAGQRDDLAVVPNLTLSI